MAAYQAGLGIASIVAERLHVGTVAAGPFTALSAAEIAAWRAVSSELLPRLWQHLRHRAGSRSAPLR